MDESQLFLRHTQTTHELYIPMPPTTIFDLLTNPQYPPNSFTPSGSAVILRPSHLTLQHGTVVEGPKVAGPRRFERVHQMDFLIIYLAFFLIAWELFARQRTEGSASYSMGEYGGLADW